MPQSSKTQPNINQGLEEELFYEYRHDRKSVDPSWGLVFEGNGHTGNGGSVASAAKAPGVEKSLDAARMSARATESAEAVLVGPGDQLVPLRGPALKIAENMEASLSIPVATSQRAMPVKVIDENRRLINQYRELAGKPKISYTHLVAWAIVRALESVPAMNQAFADRGADS
ncbi:MAG TPA: 2-oxo acid dehydrogenase subunit E2, partial [Bryobacteraceae bacterium]|nr:2-oxo acid dehydrogenase subunit E2 [Bryobacteraceae bacterium]